MDPLRMPQQNQQPPPPPPPPPAGGSGTQQCQATAKIQSLFGDDEDDLMVATRNSGGLFGDDAGAPANTNPLLAGHSATSVSSSGSSQSWTSWTSWWKMNPLFQPQGSQTQQQPPPPPPPAPQWQSVQQWSQPVVQQQQPLFTPSPQNPLMAGQQTQVQQTATSNPLGANPLTQNVQPWQQTMQQAPAAAAPTATSSTMPTINTQQNLPKLDMNFVTSDDCYMTDMCWQLSPYYQTLFQSGGSSSSTAQASASKLDPTVLLDYGKFFGIRPEIVKFKRSLRRFEWMVFLGILPWASSDLKNAWLLEIRKQREEYQKVKDQYKLDLNSTVKKAKANPTMFNPLSKAQDNPWEQISEDEELMKEIAKDVERTYSDRELFCQKQTKDVLQQVLYNWCKQFNPAKKAAESYRQGMNEICALVYQVIHESRYKPVASSPTDEFLNEFCGAQHIEADTFILYRSLMDHGFTPLFAVAAPPKVVHADPAHPAPFGSDSNKPQIVEVQNPQTAILDRCNRIMETLLKKADVDLYKQLVQTHAIPPQVFLLRWVRLLYAREFQIEDVIELWSHVFQDWFLNDESSENFQALGDYFAIAMIKYVKRDLIGADENMCMRRLMKYPPVENVLDLLKMAKEVRVIVEPQKKVVGIVVSAVQAQQPLQQQPLPGLGGAWQLGLGQAGAQSVGANNLLKQGGTTAATNPLSAPNTNPLSAPAQQQFNPNQVITTQPSNTNPLFNSWQSSMMAGQFSQQQQQQQWGLSKQDSYEDPLQMIRDGQTTAGSMINWIGTFMNDTIGDPATNAAAQSKIGTSVPTPGEGHMPPPASIANKTPLFSSGGVSGQGQQSIQSSVQNTYGGQVAQQGVTANGRVSQQSGAANNPLFGGAQQRPSQQQPQQSQYGLNYNNQQQNRGNPNPLQQSNQLYGNMQNQNPQAIPPGHTSLKEHQAVVQQKDNEIAQIENKFTELQGKARTKVQELNTKVAELQQTIVDLLWQSSEAQQSKLNMERQLQVVSEQWEDWQMRAQSMKAEVERLRNKAMFGDTDNATFQQQENNIKLQEAQQELWQVKQKNQQLTLWGQQLQDKQIQQEAQITQLQLGGSKEKEYEARIEDLKGKARKRMDEMKEYYEGQIDELEKQVAGSGNASTTTGTAATTPDKDAAEAQSGEELNKVQEELSQVKKEKEEVDGQVGALKTELEALKGKQQVHDAETAKLKSDLVEVQQKVTEAAASATSSAGAGDSQVDAAALAQLKTELETAKKETNEANTKVQAQIEQIQKLEQQVVEQKTAAAAAAAPSTEQGVDNSAELTQLKSELEQATKQVTDTTLKLELQTELVQELQAKEAAQGDSAQQSAETEAALSQLKTELETAKKEVSDQNTKMQSQTERIQQLEKDVDAAKQTALASNGVVEDAEKKAQQKIEEEKKLLQQQSKEQIDSEVSKTQQELTKKHEAEIQKLKQQIKTETEWELTKNHNEEVEQFQTQIETTYKKAKEAVQKAKQEAQDNLTQVTEKEKQITDLKESLLLMEQKIEEQANDNMLQMEATLAGKVQNEDAQMSEMGQKMVDAAIAQEKLDLNTKYEAAVEAEHQRTINEVENEKNNLRARFEEAIEQRVLERTGMAWPSLPLGVLSAEDAAWLKQRWREEIAKAKQAGQDEVQSIKQQAQVYKWEQEALQAKMKQELEIEKTKLQIQIQQSLGGGTGKEEIQKLKEESSEQIQKLTEASQQAQQEKESLNKEKEELSQKLTEAESKLAESVKQAQELQLQQQTSQQNASSNDSADNDAIEQMKKQNEETQQQLQTQLEELKQQLSTKDEDVQKLQEEKQQFEQQLEALRKQQEQLLLELTQEKEQRSQTQTTQETQTQTQAQETQQETPEQQMPPVPQPQNQQQQNSTEQQHQPQEPQTEIDQNQTQPDVDTKGTIPNLDSASATSTTSNRNSQNTTSSPKDYPETNEPPAPPTDEDFKSLFESFEGM